jgi:hypothetical protein
MAQLVARWVRLYTRRLPSPIAQRRIEEIAADVNDHIAHERADGTGERRIALGILSRMARGAAADASWRSQHVPAYRSTIRLVLATAVVLSVPLIAMQFTDEVVWTVSDFVFASSVLIGTGLLYQVATRRTGDLSYRLAAGAGLGSALMLVWAVGAVGVIGEEGDPADLMYGGVLAVGLIGAIAARLRPDGMARTLLAMAVAQALTAPIALIAGKHEAPMSSVLEIIGVNGFFAALFVGSALLFRRCAARMRRAA